MTPADGIPTRLAKITARHEKVEDVFYDGPVCRTCRDIGGSAVPYPCDAATLLTALAEAQQRITEVMALERPIQAELINERDTLQRQLAASIKNTEALALECGVLQRRLDIGKCGTCGRDAIAGDCYGCVVDRLQQRVEVAEGVARFCDTERVEALQRQVEAHQAVIRKLVETLDAISGLRVDHFDNMRIAKQWAEAALTHPLVVAARTAP